MTEGTSDDGLEIELARVFDGCQWIEFDPRTVGARPPEGVRFYGTDCSTIAEATVTDAGTTHIETVIVDTEDHDDGP